MIMVAKVLDMFKSRGNRVTPTAADVAPYRRRLEMGDGQHAIVFGPVRHMAMMGLDAMIVRDPHRAMALVKEDTQESARVFVEYYHSNVAPSRV